MSSPQYLISQKALADLEAIWRYTAETWSVPQADRYYQLIIDEIEFLAHHPQAGKSMDHVRQGYRASKVKSHLIFYRLRKEVLQIVRILHERIDIDSRL